MAKPASRSAKRGGSSIFTGVLIGLIVGAVLAVAVAVWVTGSIPFKNDGEAVRRTPAPAAPATPEPAPSFDFYKVLPGGAPDELPSAEPAAVRPIYYLQAGAFQNPADADNLKAQLALLGVEAVIQTSDVADKGVFHRVRVGPFDAPADAERTRALLAENDISATLVKELPTQQETP
ncbi:putative FtsN cell division protein [Thiobacillus denitrificans ATCC 25259]|uniref:Putative FtsN cell division protein n=1 Tax=Thiobacillus denitrificans (strain ATCC 25259 / T1) TaxID=292415 RepID=Q3SF79_THIDA|nr:SPOR domain-containing protein [Thiobacillus denitrificans]AAZ98736.1 putative FtsN cell division protein [Thiobacillus denitrificans ATCC 25259]